ncbi:MAG: long-chain fatty acid--CoA ligase, partial [Erysipelotrichales bacterium]
MSEYLKVCSYSAHWIHSNPLWSIPMIAVERVRSSALNYPDAVALTCNGLHITYRELMMNIDHAAELLKKAGIRQGMRVALILPNIPAFPYFFYACESIGVSPVLIHPLTVDTKMKILCNQSSVDFVVMTDVLYPRYRRAMDDFRLLLVNGSDVLPYFIRPFVKCASHILFTSNGIRYFREKAKSIFSEHDEDACEFLLFSSGSSGMNKGIRLNFSTLDALCTQLSSIIQPVPTKDSMFAILPFFHGFGLGVAMHTVLALGGRCILIPRLARDTIVPEFIKEKPTYIAAVPQLLRLFLKDSRMHTMDLSFVKQVFCGGEHVPQPLIDAFNRLLKNGGSEAIVQVGYGCTETLTAVCVTHGKQKGVGSPFAGNEILVVDEHDVELHQGQNGEILISGPVLMEGYDLPVENEPFVYCNGNKYYR